MKAFQTPENYNKMTFLLTIMCPSGGGGSVPYSALIVAGVMRSHVMVDTLRCGAVEGEI